MKQAHIYIGSTILKKDPTNTILNPYNGKKVSCYAQCDTDETKQALNIANSSKEQAAKIPLSKRVEWVEDVIKKLKKNREDIAQTITAETAKPIKFARIEVDRCIETLRLTVAEAISMHGETFSTDAMPSGKKTTAFYKRVPVGVVVAITPFNFPLNLVAHKLAPALISGNCVVLKPTPEACLTAYKFAKLFINSRFATKNALSVVYGDAEVGNTLVTSAIPRAISFTGSVFVGKIVMKNAGIKKVSLELGGNAASFVEKSANLKNAAMRCAFGAFSNSGQVCISLQRIYVDDKIYNEFTKLFAKESAKLKVGSCFDNDTFMSALINKDSAIRAEKWIKNAVNEGARVVYGGKREKSLLTPTVLADVTDDMKIVCEEVFAPIVSLVRISGYDEAMRKINNSPYGLQFSIFTDSIELINRFIDDSNSGGVVINDVPTVRYDIAPYGGVKMSGIGREGPKFALDEFTEIKSVVIN